MAADTLESRLTALLEPEAAAKGLELVAVEVAGSGRGPLVRVFLDHEGGITIDHIAEASHWIEELLDGLPELSSDYALEASSPGIDRPLRKRSDWERFTGSRAKVSTKTPVEGRKNFTGTIAGLEGDSVLMELDDKTYTIPLDAIDKAHLRAEIDFNREAEDGI